jgi:hypothetical protein
MAVRATNASQSYSVNLTDSAGNFLTQVPLANYGGAPPTNAFKLYTIPLSALQGVNTTIYGVVVGDAMGAAQPAIYVDAIQLVGPQGTSTPSPVGEIVCQPSSQTTQPDQTVSFSVAQFPGRTISWTAVSGNPSSGTGPNFSTKYAIPGNYQVKVTDGGPVSTCNVTITGPTTTTPTPTKTPTPSPKPGDIDGNGKVDIFDYNILLTDFGKSGSNLSSDLDKNGKVDIFDYNILLSNFGK